MFKASKYIILIYAFIPLLTINLMVKTEQQFVLLAKSFLNDHLDLNFAKYTASDLSFYNGNHFLPSGPFPAILLTPFVSLFGTNFLQGVVQFPLNILNFFLVYKISKILGLVKKKSLLLAVFYIFGSVYTPVGAIPFSWYFAQVIATTLLLLSILIFLTNKNYFLIGVSLGLAVLTRLNLVLSSVFFLIYIFKEKNRLLNLIRLLTPIMMALILTAAYNYVRFNNFFDDGHKYQILSADLQNLRAKGVLSSQHILPNLYNLLFRMPDIVVNESTMTLKFPYVKYNNWGLSIFLLSPILLILYKAKFNKKYIKASLLTIALISASVLGYFGNGWRQIGFRYALDFFPFVLIILASVIKDVSIIKLKVLIILGVVITWFFIFEKLAGF